MADSDINRAVLDDTLALRLSATGVRKTFTHAAMPLPTGYRIAGIIVTARSPRKV